MHSIVLSFPIPELKTCLFTDASDLGWAIIITQVVEWDKAKLAHEQQAPGPVRIALAGLGPLPGRVARRPEGVVVDAMG